MHRLAPTCLKNDDVHRVALEKKFPPRIIIELRGQITYRDDNKQTYTLPFCYVAMQVKPLPVAMECNDAYDDLLHGLKLR